MKNLGSKLIRIKELLDDMRIASVIHKNYVVFEYKGHTYRENSLYNIKKILQR